MMAAEEAAATLPAFQRALRHVRGVTFAGLPFEPASSAHLTVELLPLPPATRVRLRLRARGKGVDALLMVMEESEGNVSSALAGTTLCRTTPVPCTLDPHWPIDPSTLPDGAGALRGMVVVVRQAEPVSYTHLTLPTILLV